MGREEMIDKEFIQIHYLQPANTLLENGKNGDLFAAGLILLCLCDHLGSQPGKKNGHATFSKFMDENIFSSEEKTLYTAFAKSNSLEEINNLSKLVYEQFRNGLSHNGGMIDWTKKRTNQDKTPPSLKIVSKPEDAIITVVENRLKLNCNALYEKIYKYVNEIPKKQTINTPNELQIQASAPNLNDTSLVGDYSEVKMNFIKRE